MKSALEFDFFRKDMEIIFRDQLFDIIITGSYALEDFTPGKGDLDFIVLTHSDLTEEQYLKVFDLFEQYRNSSSQLKKQLEGTLYPKRALANIQEKIEGIYIGTSRKGWKRTDKFENSYVDLLLVRQAGIFLYGKEVEIYIPTKADLKSERYRDYENLLSRREAVIFPVRIHWLCRSIYYLDKGIIASKSEACFYLKKRVNDSRVKNMLS